MTNTAYVIAAALFVVCGPFFGKAIRVIARGNGGQNGR